MTEHEKIEAMKENLHRIGALYDAVGKVAALRDKHDKAALVAAVDLLYDMIKAEWQNHAALQASIAVLL